jgi:hypothetical protein
MHGRIPAALALSLALLASVGCRRQPEAGAEGLAPAVSVSNIDLGRSLNADRSIADNATSFKPTDTIYISVSTAGSAPSATLTAKWTFQDGQTVDESTQTISPTGPARTEFHISKPDGWPVGKYTVEVMLNGTLAGTKEFEVAP